ncbi:MAG: choice-of-anchor D domain-containing protein [Planctomycetota bacterium]
MKNATFRFTRTPLALAVLSAMAAANAQAVNVAWTLDGDGNWATALNWSSTPALPGGADDVTIDVGGDLRRFITINSAAVAGTLVSQENVALTVGGTLTLNGDSAVHGDFQLSGGTLGGAGTLILHGAASTWSSGTLSGAGLTQVAGALALNGNNLKDINGRTLQVLSGGTLNWSNSSNDGGRIRTGGATIANAGQWNDQNAFGNRISNDLSASASSFVNSGTYTKTGAATTEIQIAYNNSGLTDVQAGTLNLSSGGSGAGEFRAGAGGTLNFGAGGYTFGDGAVFSGAGAKNLNGGSFALNGTLTGNNLNLVAGSYSGTHTLAGEVEWSGGSFSGAGTTVVASGASFGLTGNNLKDINGRTLQVASGGSLNWSNSSNDGGRIRTGGAIITNAGQWNDQNTFGNRLSNDLSASASTFTNSGIYAKTGAATTDIAIAFNNTGTVDVQAGTLNLSGGGGNGGSGVLQAGASGTLAFSNGFNFGAGGTLGGAGAKNLNAGTFTLTGIQHVSNLNLLGGVFQGSHEFDGDVDWLGGSFSGAGQTTVLANASLVLSGNNLKDVNGRTLQVASGGSLNWSNSSNDGGRIRTGGATLTNAGQWNDLNAFGSRISNDLSASASSFANTGTFTKTGAATTEIQIAYNNSGLTDVQAGILNLTGGGSSGGEFRAGVNGALSFGGVGHSFVDGAVFSGAGAKNLNGGSYTLSGTQTANNLNFVAGSYGGTHTLAGEAEWVGGSFSGAGATSVAAGATFSLAGGNLKDIHGRSLNVLAGGTVNWSNTAHDNGRIRTGGVTFSNAGHWSDQSTFNNRISNDLSAAASSFVNSGTYTKTGAATTEISIAFNNSGLTDVQAGAFALTADVVQHVGSTLTGGTWRVGGTGFLQLNEPGAQNIVTNQGDVTLDGAAASFARINTLTDNQGAFRLLGARNFTAVGAFNNSGVLQLGGGTFGAPSLSNNVVGQRIGEIFGFGTVTPTVLNHGLVRANGGVLTMTGGIDGQSGTIQVDEGATLVLGANSDGDFLINNGTLALGASNVTVAADYTNGGFGVGNAFDARANVTGSGQILASGDVAQALVGDVVNGAGASAQMAFGNIHVGDQVTRSFAVSNTGTSGPALRGALQTSMNGGNLTDARLTGSGATAGNYGPVAAGASSASFDVTFTGGSAGALSGQAVAVVNNFDNVAEQVLSISGAVFRYANPTAHVPEPVVFANRRVGDSASQLLSLTNDVPNDGFSESLDASIGGATGNATTNGGSFSLLAAGATNSTALEVGIDTSSAGHKVGTATLTLTSNGAGTSGLGTTALGTQTVNVSGDVYRLADASTHSPSPVVFANRHVGAAATQALSLTNTAANDGFSERLNATIGAATGDVSTNGGSFSLLGAGQTDASSLTVSLDTSTAGAKSGTATISLASDGTGTSGFGALELAPQTVNVSGNVYRFAEASAHSPEPIVFANRHVGSAASQALTLSNLAAADGFSESLDASIGGATGNATTNGGSFGLLAAGASNGTALAVGIDTSSAGAKSGTATITLTSNGAGTSELGTTALGTQTVNVSGNVFRFAEASAHSPEPIVFANRHVGSAASQALTLSNLAAADGFSESLDASIGGATGNATTNGGSFGLLAAGATNASSLAVGIDTSSAGHKVGTATITLTSNGASTSELGTTALGTQTVNVSGNVYRFAQAGTVTAVEFGNVHVGDVVSRTLSLSNIAAADGFSESLDAVFGGVSDTRILTSGGVSGLAAGATDSSSLVVGLDTSTAGSLTGFATLNFTSNGAGTSGLGTTSLGFQNVGVTTNVAVYRFAEGAVDTAQPVDFGAFRVGDVAGTQGVTVRNAAVNDGFSESLDVSVASVDAGFTASGAVTGLAAGASNGSGINVGLDTSTAGTKTGQATLDYVSNGTGTSDLGLTAVGSEAVALTGRVYAQAVASVETVGIDFGIVHVGDVIGAQSVTVRNVAAGTLTDNLLGSISAVPAGFVGNGSLGATGLTQGEASSALNVGLSTNAAGVFSGEASLSFASHNAEMADLLLGNQAVTLSAQVNNYANAVLDKAGGDGTFAQVNVGQFVFDFGTLTAGGNVAGLLSLANVSPGGPTDVLGADFDIGGGSFTLNGFDAFSGLATTDSTRMLEVSLNPMVAGLFEQVVRINLYGENASGFRGSLGTYELSLRALVEPAPVPLPAPAWLFGGALGTLLALRRSRARAAM